MTVEGLKNGRHVTLRELKLDDVDRSHQFFMGLPADDRRYLRVDVTRRELVEHRIRESVEGGTYRLVALVDDKVVGDGALEFSGEGWRRHNGEIRVIISREYQELGLGKLLIAALFRVAQQRGLERVVAKLASPQTRARKILERLGFHVDSVVPDYIEDVDGNVHAMVIMSCTLDEMSKELKGFYRTDHWPDG